MPHKYLRHKCLRNWDEIAKLNVTECELSNWIAKINVVKSLKIFLNAKSNVHTVDPRFNELWRDREILFDIYNEGSLNPNFSKNGSEREDKLFFDAFILLKEMTNLIKPIITFSATFDGFVPDSNSVIALYFSTSDSLFLFAVAIFHNTRIRVQVEPKCFEFQFRTLDASEIRQI